MAGIFVNICGPVVADTVYSDGVLVARDVSITLPEVTPQTADVSAMGTMSLPIWQLLDNMEASITKIGIDNGLGKLLLADIKPIEVRWVQTVTDANGATKNVGCKAFLRGTPNKIPGVGLELASPSENEVTLMVTRYALYADGEEICLIDRLAGIVRILNKDYAQDLTTML
jgi:phage tail tube protein FII